MRLASLLLVAGLVPVSAFAQVANDGTAVVSQAGNFANPITLSSKTTSGSDRAGIVQVGWEDSGGATISSVTWNGVAMTHVVTQVNDILAPTSRYNAALYVIVNPPTGGSSVVVNFTDDIRGAAAAVSFNGVHQTTPIRGGSTVGLETIAGGTQQVTVNATSGDMAVDAMMDNSVSGATVGAGQTQTFKLENTAGGEHWGMGSYEALSGSSVNMTWNSTDTIALVGAALQAAGGGAAPTPRMSLLGVGPFALFRWPSWVR